MDVTKESEIHDAAEWVKERFGEIDAVVDVAGVLLSSDRTETLLTESLEDIREQIEVNALGIITVFREFLPVIKTDGMFIGVTSEGGSFAMKEACSRLMEYQKRQQIKLFRRCVLL